MSLSASGRTWEEASSPAAVRLARRFEAAWRDAADGDSGSGHGRDQRHPDPDDFLPDDPSAYPGARLALLARRPGAALGGGRAGRGRVVSRRVTPTSATRPWSP